MIESKPIIRKRGQTSAFDIEFTNAGAALPLDGTVVLVVTRQSSPKSSDVPLMTLWGTIQPAPDDNVVRFQPAAEDADNLGSFFYGVKHTDTNGFTRPLLQGEFLITESRAILDEEFSWTPPTAPADGVAMSIDGSEFWYQPVRYPSDAFTYQTRDTRRILRVEFDTAEFQYGRALFPYGPECPRPKGAWFRGWEFEAVFYSKLARPELALTSPGYWDHASYMMDNRAGTISPEPSGQVIGEWLGDYPSTVGWPDEGWYVVGLRITPDGEVWHQGYPETLAAPGWTQLGFAEAWPAFVPFSASMNLAAAHPDDPLTIIDLYRFGWKRL